MGKVLSADAVAQYRRDGFYFPLPVLSAAEARGYREKLEEHERATGAPLAGGMRHKVHLLFTWANELARHPAILDAVEDVIGPDILCWNSSFFTKERQSPGFVSWHQDATYWGLSEPDVVTAWVAFTESTPVNGNMRVTKLEGRIVNVGRLGGTRSDDGKTITAVSNSVELSNDANSPLQGPEVILVTQSSNPA